eukprot:9483780-Heterocapsa_arctica.AAC.1
MDGRSAATSSGSGYGPVRGMGQRAAAARQQSEPYGQSRRDWRDAALKLRQDTLQLASSAQHAVRSIFNNLIEG